MLIKNLLEEDFINYKKPSMFIAFPRCTFKCDYEAGCSICQNSGLAHDPDIEISAIEIVSRYVKNPITHAVVIGGLEPFDSFGDLYELVRELRKFTEDDIVIYTGYKEAEFKHLPAYKAFYKEIASFSNIIIKFGRFIPGQEPHYDDVLGVKLASSNQYARRIS